MTLKYNTLYLPFLQSELCFIIPTLIIFGRVKINNDRIPN